MGESAKGEERSQKERLGVGKGMGRTGIGEKTERTRRDGEGRIGMGLHGTERNEMDEKGQKAERNEAEGAVWDGTICDGTESDWTGWRRTERRGRKVL